MKFNILFFGTSQFSLPVLEALHEHHQVKLVVTQPDKPVGRKGVLTPPPVKVKAQELGIPAFQPEKAIQTLEHIQERIDFVVTASYGQYLPKKILELPFKDALNVHPSLLPLYRGATPMQSALLNGDEKTGVTIMRMVKQMDAGPLYNQIQFPLPKEMKYPELEEKSSKLGAELLLSVIKNINSLSPQPQQEKQVTFCNKFTKKDGEALFEEQTAQQIFNKLRAFTPWPGVYTWFKGQKLNLLEFSIVETNNNTVPGTIYTSEDGQVFISCKEGALSLQSIQLAGKSPMDIKAFLNGYQDFIGSTLPSS